MNNCSLYIIGNGFDLHHRLKTSYGDFCQYIKENDKELYEFLEGYVYLESDKEGLWNNFEQNLDTFDHGEFYSDYDNTEPSHEEFRPSDMYGIVDELWEISENMIEKMQLALYNWLDKIDYTDMKYKPLSLDTKALYLTFNYTPTLNRLYSISNDNILHIHHSIVKHGSDLVFGHGTVVYEEPELDEDGNSNYPYSSYREAEEGSKRLLTHFYKDTKKHISENRKFFDSLHDIDKIIVLGHSLNDIDLPYFKHLNEIVNQAKWIISYYDDSEPEKMRNALLNVGVGNDALSFVKIEDITV